MPHIGSRAPIDAGILVALVHVALISVILMIIVFLMFIVMLLLLMMRYLAMMVAIIIGLEAAGRNPTIKFKRWRC